MLIKVGEFIFPVDFLVLEPERVSNAESHIPVILGCAFLATSNDLINCKNGMTKLSFGNMTPDLNIFNPQRQSDCFDDIDHSTLNWVDAVSHDELEKNFSMCMNLLLSMSLSLWMMNLSMMCLILMMRAL